MKSAGLHVSHSSHPSRRPFVAPNVVKGVRTTATNARMSATTVRNEGNTDSCSKRMAVISIAGLLHFLKVHPFSCDILRMFQIFKDQAGKRSIMTPRSLP